MRWLCHYNVSAAWASRAQTKAESNEQRERGRSWRSLPHFVCNQVAWPHTFSRGYFICVPISGHVQFHLRRLTQRSIKPEGKSQRTKRFGWQKSSVKRVSGIGNIFPTKINQTNNNRKQTELSEKFWWLFKQLTVVIDPQSVANLKRNLLWFCAHSHCRR